MVRRHQPCVRAGEARQMFDLGMAMRRETRDRNRADFQAGEICDGTFQAIRQLENDALSGADTAGGEMNRDAIDHPPQFAIRDAPLAVDHRLAIGVLAHRLVEDVADRDAAPMAARDVTCRGLGWPWRYPVELRGRHRTRPTSALGAGGKLPSRAGRYPWSSLDGRENTPTPTRADGRSRRCTCTSS